MDEHGGVLGSIVSGMDFHWKWVIRICLLRLGHSASVFSQCRSQNENNF